MSFGTQVQRFAAQAAKHRETMSCVSVLPDGATKHRSVFLGPDRAERDITENGYVVIHKRTLRVQKVSLWTPEEGDEFVVRETSERFRINVLSGGGSSFAGEWIGECVRIK